MKRIVKNPEVRRSEIIQAAQELIFKENSTMQSIMDHLGIAKGTIYHYFTSKEELLEVALEDLVDKHLEKLKLKNLKGNAFQKLKVLIGGSKLAAPQIFHDKGNEAIHLRLLVFALMKLAPLYAELIEQGCDEGLFQTDSPLECAEFILSAVQFLTDTGIHPWSCEDLKRRKKAFPHMIEQMLKAPPKSFQFLGEL